MGRLPAILSFTKLFFFFFSHKKVSLSFPDLKEILEASPSLCKEVHKDIWCECCLWASGHFLLVLQSQPRHVTSIHKPHDPWFLHSGCEAVIFRDNDVFICVKSLAPAAVR